MDALMGILGTLGGFLGGFLSAVGEWVGPPTEWPGWAYAGLGVAALMGLVAYAWNRTGKGFLVVLALLAAFLVFVVMGAVR